MNRPSLADAELFRHISPERLQALGQRLRHQRYGAGGTVIGQSDASTDLFVVLEGAVRVTLFSARGQEVSFRDMGQGETVGLLSAIDGKPRSASVVARLESHLAIIPSAVFLEELEHSPEMMQATLLHLSQLVRQLSERVVEFSTLVARNRVQVELLRLAADAPKRTDGTVVIEPAPTHQEIANRISTQRETVSREFSAMAKNGLISKGRGGLIIRNVDLLAALVRQETGFDTDD